MAASQSELPKDTRNSANNFAYQAGRRSFFIHGLWIRFEEDLFDTNTDCRGNTVEVFKNDESPCHRWLRHHFMRGLDTQRHDAATWIRQNCSRILGVSESDLKPNVRGAKFREEIGWDRKSGLYSTVDVPILHKDWRGEYSPSSAFLNPKLMRASLSFLVIYLALVHGPSAQWGFVNDGPAQAQTTTIAQAHKIRNITPGAIATCAILARWTLSADDALEEVGSNTGIHYFDDYERYFTILETGQRANSTVVVNIMKRWDEEIFPNGSDAN